MGDEQKVIEAAMEAREKSVAPFSSFKVGAAVQADDGNIYTGCNIESASYGLTVCAERVAIWKALSEGARCFGILAIAADTRELTPPCGTCRQIIWEFCRNSNIVLINLRGDRQTLKIADLLPRAFDAKYLRDAQRHDSEAQK